MGRKSKAQIAEENKQAEQILTNASEQFEKLVKEDNNQDTKEKLRQAIDVAIKLCHELMLEDRSTTLRIKNVVAKLKDSLKVIC